jgi:hypothetical protein
MPSSTPLDKIETNNIPDKEASDEERVSRIIQEMNSNGSSPGTQQQEAHGQEQIDRIPSSTRYVSDPVIQPHPSEMVYNSVPERTREPVNKIEEPSVPAPAKKNIWAHISDILKIPVVVAVIFFVLSLPIVDTYLAKYASWAFSNNGTLNMTGLAVKALGAGTVTGVYETLDKLISRFL